MVPRPRWQSMFGLLGLSNARYPERSKTMKRFLAGVVLGGVLSVGGIAWGAFSMQYTLTDLGAYEAVSIDKATNRVIAKLYVNTDITGIQDQYQAFQLYPTVINLGAIPGRDSTEPFDVSTTAIVGESAPHIGDTPPDNPTHAFLYSDGQIRDLGTLGSPELGSWAQCVNEDLDVFGYAQNPTDTGVFPVVWLNGQTIMKLPVPAGYRSGRALTCNDRGDAAGFALRQGTRCFYWSVSGSTFDCHPDNGTEWSEAIDLLSSGLIVANASQGSRYFGYIYFWSGISWLMPLAGDVSSRVESMNELGDAVGLSVHERPDGSDRAQAVGWENGRAFPLLARTRDAHGWSFVVAQGISNDGLIVVNGFVNGQARVALLTPVESEVTAYYKWRFKIHQYYVNQYWRTLRAYYHSQ
jgi:probable HAF family extracellular repeat protein